MSDHDTPRAQPTAAERRVLVLPPTTADGTAIRKLMEACDLRCLVLPNVAALCDAMRDGVGTVVIAEEALVADSYRFLEHIRAQEVWSDLPVIVLSRYASEPLALSEIVPLGNFSVIERPVRTSTLVSLVRSSLRGRSRQYETRTHLLEQENAQREREQLLESERAARAEAERSGRMKDEFLATLGHELRTPLNAIFGWSQVLRRSRGIEPEVAEAVKVIERNARSQAQIIEDLLDMSSIVSGKVRLHMQRVDLAAVVEASIKVVRPAAEAKDIRLGVTVDPEAGAVNGDPNRLQQVFWNLLTNAVKFTPQGGEVAVRLARVNAQCRITVVDNGMGIDAAFLPHIFERFRQADASASRGYGGLGLGLSIVKQLVELHGGMIEATSDGTGKGSAFTVSLPVAATSPAATGLSDTHAQHSRLLAVERYADVPRAKLEGIKVLVVDDEPDARSLIERLLQDCEATVTTAGSASEAFEHVAREKPDVLLSDIGMPKEDGYALIRRIRKLEGERGRIPAIALTAYARAEDRAKAIEAGYQSHLPKPVEAMKLLTMVASLVNRPQV